MGRLAASAVVTPLDNIFVELESKIRSRQATVGIIGLGYVGLPLALSLTEVGYRVKGLDVDPERVRAIQNGHSYITDVSDVELAQATADRRFIATSDFQSIGMLDAIIICVPTPLRKTKDPDMSYVMAAADAIASGLRRGQLVILESTTYPGTTEELILARFEETGLHIGEDFFLAYSPERIDPGNKEFPTRNIPKVVGGITTQCASLAGLLYSQCMQQVHIVSSTRVAEMVKLLENSFRSVNIALANEFALLCSHMKIDVWEVIKAASTKPFGFMPFYPGPGLGGHCIPIDPMYLVWKARVDGFDPRFIELADKINSNMPRFVTQRAMELLNQKGKSLKGSRIHLLGVAYKRDTGDFRESPALEIMKLCLAAGATISYSDPFIERLTFQGHRYESMPLCPEVLWSCDLAMIITDHSQVDYSCVVKEAPLVFDTRNATQGLHAENLVRL